YVEKIRSSGKFKSFHDILSSIPDSPQKNAYPSIRYFTCLNKVTANNDVIDKIIERHRSLVW
ncbi:hypothetical protein NEQG_01242, partial [Nematocida parisii ERTm3]